MLELPRRAVQCGLQNNKTGSSGTGLAGSLTLGSWTKVIQGMVAAYLYLSNIYDMATASTAVNTWPVLDIGLGDGQ